MGHRTGSLRSSLLIGLLLIHSTGCATWSSVPLTTAPRDTPAVAVGDIVRVTQLDGNTTDLRVMVLWPDSLRGSMRFRPDSTRTLAWNQIRRLERFDSRSGESIGFVFGALLVLGILRQSLDDT